MPMFSVQMPVHNSRPFIRAAVRSVQDQTFKNFELIIVDDGSTDGSLNEIRDLVVADPRLRIVANERQMGVARTRNRALAMSSGSVIAFLDSDDLWTPNHLEVHHACLAARPDVCMAFSDLYMFSGDQTEVPQYVQETLRFVGQAQPHLEVVQPCGDLPTAYVSHRTLYNYV